MFLSFGGVNGLFWTVLVFGLFGAGGCGEPEREGARPLAAECDTARDCPAEQPYCHRGECFPCIYNEHCDSGRKCVKAITDHPYVGFRYCSHCGHGLYGCGEGRVCDMPRCNYETNDCDGPARCVPTGDVGLDVGTDAGTTDARESS